VLLGPTDPAERDRRLYPLRWAASAPRLAPTALRNMLDAGPWQTRRALAQARRDPVEDKLGLIESPTLVVRGSRDWVTPRSWAQKVAERIPVARLETIEHAGHMPANGAVGRLTGMIEDFLAEELEPARVATGSERPRARWIVDGMNVIGTRPDGWWRDRKRAWRRLHHRLEQLAAEGGDEVRLVLDGARPGTWRDNGLVECCFAAGGRGAADDAIVARVEADPRSKTLTVVTSDRELAERVRELGADVVASRRFLDRLEAV
ncbi:MAG: NYN domain-containing protein, partial [Solirubrobacterales bacterium]